MALFGTAFAKVQNHPGGTGPRNRNTSELFNKKRLLFARLLRGFPHHQKLACRCFSTCSTFLRRCSVMQGSRSTLTRGHLWFFAPSRHMPTDPPNFRASHTLQENRQHICCWMYRIILHKQSLTKSIPKATTWFNFGFCSDSPA